MSLAHRIGFSAREAEWVFLQHAAAVGALSMTIDDVEESAPSLGEKKELESSPIFSLLQTKPTSAGAALALRLLKGQVQNAAPC